MLFNRRFRWSVRRQPDNEAATNPRPFDMRPGTFHQVWEEKQLPGPGAQNFAYESLALPEFTPVGPGVGIRQQIVPLEEPLYVYQAVIPQGIPIVAGTVVMQPLFDPRSDNGFPAPIDGAVIPISVLLNDPRAAINQVMINPVV